MKIETFTKTITIEAVQIPALRISDHPFGDITGLPGWLVDAIGKGGIEARVNKDTGQWHWALGAGCVANPPGWWIVCMPHDSLSRAPYITCMSNESLRQQVGGSDEH